MKTKKLINLINNSDAFYLDKITALVHIKNFQAAPTEQVARLVESFFKNPQNFLDQHKDWGLDQTRNWLQLSSKGTQVNLKNAVLAEKVNKKCLEAALNAVYNPKKISPLKAATTLLAGIALAGFSCLHPRFNSINSTEIIQATPLASNGSSMHPFSTIPSSIHVFTSYTQDNPERLQMSHKVMKQQQNYCEKHKYRYSVFEENLALEAEHPVLSYWSKIPGINKLLSVFGKILALEPENPILPYWSKIAGINKLLNDPENKEPWIVWLDDDAVVLNTEIELLQFIHTHGGEDPDTHIIVTQDTPIAPTDLNTGVLIVRNSDQSRDFFKKLWEKRTDQIQEKAYSYGNCPNQECLHEQQAMHDLLKQGQYPYVKIIPQRDDKGIGINTFARESHYDINRKMTLIYKDHTSSACNDRTDFICQCTGLATKGQKIDFSGAISEKKVINFRERCIDSLIQASKIGSKRL